ncbi:NADPH:quinone oxidoreductase family protein [Alteromonas sp. ASW11-130]|uniref:NADPH:quinone oxidoreductase family protein n=1 Tax=Alteromonas sp. ASW11-130 TaxID=3015775 RepID=UPI0022422D7E|nr:NADPH:quinone oxidoreductase family protein [Alteromonas sp. ASW11-130]MCW8090255.1 NADPH:quinone oxidoreductase family protein [Alteromonas sp. ASW11-130]
MKAIVCNEFGPVEQLTYTDVEDPEVGDNEILIGVTAAGVNFPDALLVQGLYQMQPDFPFIPGNEVAGTILKCGKNVTSFKDGDRVVGINQLGGFAEKVALPASQVMPIPEGVTEHAAAGLVTAHATAHHALKQRAQLGQGETLLVTGAAGGTGLAAVQIGKRMGAKVIAVCSTEEKLQLAQKYGADETINYMEKDLKETLKELTQGKGIDVVYDCVGGDAFHACARAMAWGGRLLTVGYASGEIPKLAANLALVKGFSLVGVFWGQFTQKEPEVFRHNMNELFSWAMAGDIEVHIAQTYPLSEAATALNQLMNREVKGKLILTI